jgi:NAD(P)H-hydrate epimerase
LVVDADGLNALSRIPRWWTSDLDLVVTPHPGEMARLTGLSIAEIQRDRVGVARRYAQKWKVVVVLKGAGTIVATPDGRIFVNPTGGPNLATAGTGDVLTGTIAGLVAQGMSTEEAAVAGVYLHGLAGDLAAQTLGEVGTVASDLLPLIPKARLAIMTRKDDT